MHYFANWMKYCFFPPEDRNGGKSVKMAILKKGLGVHFYLNKSAKGLFMNITFK